MTISEFSKEDYFGFCAEFWEIDRSKLNDQMKFSDKILNDNSSFRFYQFVAALESNFGVQVSDVNNVESFGELYRKIIRH
jgi:hypothetical protein